MASSLKMAVPESSVDSRGPIQNANKSNKDAKAKDKKVIVAAQEIKYAKCLAGNEKRTRDKALKSLTKWLHQRCVALPFTEADFMLLWKGLFYSIWMSDKPLIQEECAENIARLIHSLTPNARMMFYKCGLRTLSNEWFGIDQLRLDKFLMLVRRMVRQSFVALKQLNWSMKTVREFQQLLDDTVLNNKKNIPLGLCLHFTEVYLEELAKVSEGEIHPMLLIELLTPFTKQLATTNDSRQLLCITKNIFKHLMKQSDSGLEYNEKFHAWKRMGFPGGNIDCLQKGDVSDEDASDNDEKMSDEDDDVNVAEKPLDPRAGRVNVDLPQLKFHPKHIIAMLTKYRFAPESNTKSRKAITKLIAEFTQMMNGRFPLGMKKVELYKDGNSTKLKQSVNRLVKFEKKLMQNNKKRKLSDVLAEEQTQPKKHKQAEVPEPVKQKKKAETRKRRSESDSDESILPEEVYKNFESAFERNSGTWYVYNGDGDMTDGEGRRRARGRKEEAAVNEEEISEAQENGDDGSFLDERGGEKVKRRKTKKPVKWNRDCSIQLITENLKSPKRKAGEISSGKKVKLLDVNIINGSEKIETTTEETPQLSKSSEIIPYKLNKSPEKVQSSEKSPQKMSKSPEKVQSPQKMNKSLEKVQSPQKLNKSVEKVQSPQKLNKSLETPQKGNKSLEKVETPQKGNKSSPSAVIKETTPKKKNSNSPVVKGSDSPVIKQKHSVENGGSIAETQIAFEPESKSTPEKLFQQTEWDSPLKDGEMEFFVVSNKYKEKNKLGSVNANELIKSSLSKIKGKNAKHRASLDPSLVRNPFSMYGTPKSGKKVKIDLRLNKSQEVHEHEATIKMSPAIPFDANRKPVKPLLKPNAVSSPIDPFYRRRLHL